MSDQWSSYHFPEASKVHTQAVDRIDKALSRSKNFIKLMDDRGTLFFTQDHLFTTPQYKKFRASLANSIYLYLSVYRQEKDQDIPLIQITEGSPFEAVLPYLTEHALMCIDENLELDLAMVIWGLKQYTGFNRFLSDDEHVERFMDELNDMLPTELSDGNNEFGYTSFGGGVRLLGSRMTDCRKDGLIKDDGLGAYFTPFSWEFLRQIKSRLLKTFSSEEYIQADPDEQVEIAVESVRSVINRGFNLIYSTGVISHALHVYGNIDDGSYREFMRDRLGLDEYIPGIVTDKPMEEFSEEMRPHISFAKRIEWAITELVKTHDSDVAHICNVPEMATKSAIADLTIDLIRREYTKGNGIVNMSNFAQRVLPSDADMPTVTVEFLKIYYEKIGGLLCSMITDEFYPIDDEDEISDMVNIASVGANEAYVRNALKKQAENEKQIDESVHIEYKRTISNLEQKVAELQKACKAKEHDAAVENSAKTALESQLEELRSQYKDLSDELDKANDLIAAMSDNDSDSLDEEETRTVHEFADKRILFVRKHQASGYKVMTDILKQFPSAKFTTAVSSRNEVQPYDCVVLMTRYLAHGTYWKARDMAKLVEGTGIITCDSASIKGIIDALRKAETKKDTSAYVSVGRHVTQGD